MFRAITDQIKKIYHRAINSIAFAPALISIFLGGLSVLLLYFSHDPLNQWLGQRMLIFQNLDVEAAQNLLSVITGGSISITVFSFSMVMLVMTQASTIYTPKLLDGLTRDKRPQRILGVFIGTVLFCLPQLLLLNETKEIPLTALLIAIILMMLNMFIFIAFIDYVSKSIKPAVICRRIYLKVSGTQYRQTEAREGWEPHYEKADSLNFETTITSKKPGYLQNINTEALMEICEEHNLRMAVLQREGQFVLKGTPLLEISGLEDTDDDELLSSLHSAFFYSDIENVEGNSYFAYRQLTDLAVKAMSPGINDIGTARIAIDLMIDLISKFAQNRVPYYILNKEKKCSIRFEALRLHDLFELCLDQVRIYSTADKHVMLSLMRGCLLMLQQNADNEELKTEIRSFSQRLLKNLRSNEGVEYSEYIEKLYEQEIKQYLE